MRLLKEKYNTQDAAGRKILDYGSDVLHVGHNAFRDGLKASPIDTSELAKCIHGFFKHSVLRRADFALELIDLEMEEQLSFLRHVDTRWLSLGPALERIDKFWEAITHYFLC